MAGEADTFLLIIVSVFLDTTRDAGVLILIVY